MGCRKDDGYYSLAMSRLKLVEKYKAENKRLKKRDGNATIELCYDDGNNPFAREELKVVDIGVSDNIYVVESQVVSNLRSANERLRDAIKSWPCGTYYKAQDDGCDSVGAWDCFVEAMQEWSEQALNDSLAPPLQGFGLK